METTIEVKKLCKSYANVKAVQNINISICRGEVFGLLVGGIAPNMKIAGIAASLLYFPMLIFSGAILPYEVMPVALQKVADILPLTQGIKLKIPEGYKPYYSALFGYKNAGSINIPERNSDLITYLK